MYNFKADLFNRNTFNIAKLMVPLYAGSHSELNLLISYLLHYNNFMTINEPDMIKIYLELSLRETAVMTMMREYLISQRVQPVYTEYPILKWHYNSPNNYNYYKSVKKMIYDDIVNETALKEIYTDIYKVADNLKDKIIIERLVATRDTNLKILYSELNKN